MWWRLPEEVVGHLAAVGVRLHWTLCCFDSIPSMLSPSEYKTLWQEHFFQVVGEVSCLFLELLEQKNSFAWDSVSRGAGILFLAGIQWLFPVISSRKEHARFLMIVAAEMARHMHGHCHRGSLAIVNSRRAGFKKMKDDFLCSTSENWTCAVFEVPCQKSKLELLRKDRIRKTWQPCVQPWLELKFRQNATCERQSAFF